MNDFADPLAAEAPSGILPGMRSGAEYLRQISNDGRHVYLDGELVRDVPNHPAFAGAARSIARLYDIAADPANEKVMTFT